MVRKRWNCEQNQCSGVQRPTIIVAQPVPVGSTITYDTLVRAGVECTSANVQNGGSPYGSVGTSPALVVCSRGVKILPDTTLQPLNAGPVCAEMATCDPQPHPRSQDKYDALIIPGGLKGAETLSESTEVQTLVREYYEGNKIVAMICAGASRIHELCRG